MDRQKVSARAVAKSLASALGMQESIVDKLADLQINQGYTEESVQVAMRDLPEFKQRFAGMDKYNKNFAADIAAGRKAQVVDPFTYLQLEKDYQEVLTRYGLGDMANQNTFAELIGNDVSVQETRDRITNVYDKINNADELLKTQLETLGITREAARQGFSTVAENLQPLSKFAQIYEGTTTGLEEELTAETFKGLESQRRKRLVQREIGTFSGESGISRTSLSTRGTAGNI